MTMSVWKGNMRVKVKKLFANIFSSFIDVINRFYKIESCPIGQLLVNLYSRWQAAHPAQWISKEDTEDPKKRNGKSPQIKKRVL